MKTTWHFDAVIADIDKMIAQLKARVAQPVTIDYTVAKGDNLWNISKMERIYADPYMWPRLYRANKEQIQDPDLIYPDQTLAVPFGVAENQHLVTRGTRFTRPTSSRSSNRT